MIQEIKERRLFKDRKLVIVGSLVNRTPYSEHSFIYGEPISPHVLKRANISEAGVIFVFSNNRFSDPDIKTLHVCSRIKKLNGHSPLYVELHNQEHELLKELPGEVIVMTVLICYTKQSSINLLMSNSIWKINPSVILNLFQNL